MDTNKKLETKTNPLFILSAIGFGLLALNLLFLMLFASEVRTYKLVQKEMVILKQDEKIIKASSDITKQYQEEISVISNVFPNESSFPIYIQTLENELKKGVDEYQIKFSPNPVAEGDKLFFLMSLTIKSDLNQFLGFLQRLENLHYMTHITGVSARAPGGMNGKGEYSIGMKIYVQNPFNTK